MTEFSECQCQLDAGFTIRMHSVIRFCHQSFEIVMFDDINDLYQQVILDHCKQPRNFHEMPAATCSAQGHNPLCGDQLKLFLTLDGDIIKDVSFVGSGCCISKASASLLTEFAKGKTKADVEKMFGQVHEMVTTGNVAGRRGQARRVRRRPQISRPREMRHPFVARRDGRVERRSQAGQHGKRTDLIVPKRRDSHFMRVSGDDV